MEYEEECGRGAERLLLPPREGAAPRELELGLAGMAFDWAVGPAELELASHHAEGSPREPSSGEPAADAEGCGFLDLERVRRLRACCTSAAESNSGLTSRSWVPDLAIC